ncbi:hypothetical protein [Lysinibacillus xylanilyticus]|uniref:hypothetical protein n=1 Tax=Lysinibacillus xylanilyticus TaxID=582475 RepID=UPI0036DBCC37
MPKKYGGEEISLYEMLLVQEQLAKGDASTALSVGWHLLTFLNVREAGTWPEPIFAELCHKAVKEGSLLNIINSERGKGNISRGSLPGTIAKKVPGGYIISGEKAFASLAPILKQFTIIAFIEEENLTAEFLTSFRRCSNTCGKKLKPPADVTESERSALCKHKADSGRNYAEA